MHFNIYVEDETGNQLNRLARRLRTSRNAVIRQALQEWVANKGRKQWPRVFLEFQGEPGFTPFESHRSDLADQSQRDPLA